MRRRWSKTKKVQDVPAVYSFTLGIEQAIELLMHCCVVIQYQTFFLGWLSRRRCCGCLCVTTYMMDQLVLEKCSIIEGATGNTDWFKCARPLLLLSHCHQKLFNTRIGTIVKPLCVCYFTLYFWSCCFCCFEWSLWFTAWRSSLTLKHFVLLPHFPSSSVFKNRLVFGC